jgi:Arc/MetJ-type ribon-helix-helix transcriptional regulator
MGRSYYPGSIGGMKVSVSLPSEDVDFLDRYARAMAGGSRSAAVHRAVLLLRESGLGEAYEQAWDEWTQTEEGVWEPTIADGLDH